MKEEKNLLCFLSPTKELKSVKTLTDLEGHNFITAVTLLSKFNTTYDFSQKVIKSFCSLVNDLQTISTAKKDYEYRSLLTKTDINTELLTCLNLFKTFLDNTLNELSQLYGKNSIEYANFKSATNNVFDNYNSYVIIYALRNYAQHADFQIINTSYISQLNHSTLQTENSCAIYLDRNTIFTSAHITARQKQAFEIYPDNKLPLIPIIQEFIAALNILITKNITLRLDLLERKNQYLYKILSMLPAIPYNSTPLFIKRLTYNKPSLKLETIGFPIKIMEQISQLYTAYTNSNN